MKIIANSIRQGNILLHREDLWVVSKTPEHTKPGKGGAYVQVEMKNIKSGTKLNERFSSSDNVERVILDKKTCTYLYLEDGKIVLMDNENFEQIYLEKDILDEKTAFLVDGMFLEVEFYNDLAVSVELPSNVIVEIEQTDPVMKGSTITSSYKPAILTNGIRVMVPPYLTSGEKIVVKTEDCSFVERAK